MSHIARGKTIPILPCESSISSTGPDGSFHARSSARPGHLIVEGPSDDYVLQEVGERMIFDGLPGGRRRYSHAIIALKIEPSDTEREVNVTLRRGMTVKGELSDRTATRLQKRGCSAEVSFARWV